MTGSEAEIAAIAGKVGGAGVIMYALVRFGPLIESIVLRRKAAGNGSNGEDNAASKRLQRLGYITKEEAVTWESLSNHCDRAHKAATDLMDRELKHIRSNLEGLGRDMRDLTREIRNGNTKQKGG